LPQGYVANFTRVPEYRAAIERGALPIARIRALSGDDRLRREVIFQIMCNLRADTAPFADADAALQRLADDGIVERKGTQIKVTTLGRPFMRHVAACFDPYLAQGAARHSSSV
jgi:oxygen-independent coproporphyrinogen-3 oxidase